jgi:hypothetical protein
LAVIANQNIASHQQEPLNIDDVIALYGLKKQLLGNGERAILLSQPFDSEASIQFCKHLFDSFPYQVKRKWDVAVFSGRAIRPTMLESNEVIMEYISGHPNAIGYVLVEPTQINLIREKFHVIATFN